MVESVCELYGLLRTAIVCLMNKKHQFAMYEQCLLWDCGTCLAVVLCVAIFILF